MEFKSIFNIILYTFVMVVPLMPIKIKLAFMPLSADFVIGALLIGIGLIYIAFSYKKDRHLTLILRDKRIKILTIFIALFTFLSLISITYAESKGAVVSESLRFIEYILIFYLILIITDRKSIKNTFILLYAAMIVACICGVLQFSFRLSTDYDSDMPFKIGRIYSTFANPNYWGPAVNMIIFYPLVKLIEKKNKMLNVIIFSLFFFNLVFCYTRGAWGGFAIGIIVICILEYRKLLLLLPVLGVAGLLTPFIRGRILSIFANGSSVSSRVILWKTGLLMFKDHILFGVGNGNYLARYLEYVTKYPDLYLGRDQFTVHNSYIKMLAELGLIGGILFVLIYLTLVWITFRIYRDSRSYKIIALGFLGFWGAYLFQNFLNNLMFIPQLNVFVWIISALLYKGYLLEKQGE